MERGKEKGPRWVFGSGESETGLTQVWLLSGQLEGCAYPSVYIEVLLCALENCFVEILRFFGGWIRAGWCKVVFWDTGGKDSNRRTKLFKAYVLGFSCTYLPGNFNLTLLKTKS